MLARSWTLWCLSAALAAGVDRPRVPKCCPLGETVSDDGGCTPSDLAFAPYFDDVEYNDTELSVVLDQSNSDIIVGDPCQYEKYRLEPYLNDDDNYYLLWNGSLWVPRLYPDVLLGPGNYCLDTFVITSDYLQEEVEVVLPLLCFSKPEETPFALQFVLYPIGLLTSVPFLVATMLVYCLLPELRNLHGKTLSCHVMCLATAYIFLAAVQLGGTSFSEEACISIAFVIQFAFQACFFWLQVLCFDTWWVVRSCYNKKKAHVEKLEDEAEAAADAEAGGAANMAFDHVDSLQRPVLTVCCFPLLVDGGKVPSKATERKVFLCYSLYGWMCPIVLVVASLTANLIPTIPLSYMQPKFGLYSCWFNTEEAELNYFYGPVIYILVTNLIMFIHTSYMIFCINRWNNPGKNEKRCFLLCFSLFFVMGINWILEVVSWAAGGPAYIWYVTDFINTLQGVIIFCIFVMEPYVRSLVHRKLWPRVSKVLCKCRGNEEGSQAQAGLPRTHPDIAYSSVTTGLPPKPDP